jgi:hypothetical protein
MIIRYQPRQYFQGRIYTENHADECGTLGSNFGPTFLTLPLGSSTKEQRCGIHRAFDYETPNRTLVFTYIIIQTNPLVMMQSDRYIKVGCISRLNRTSGSGIPDFVSVEASMEFNNKDYDGLGSMLIDHGGDIPKISVYVLDPLEDIPIKEAKIGQILKLVIAMESQIADYDLRAINMTATTMMNDKLELIGPTGCPKNSALFPAFQHETTPTSKRLVTKFKAFKFASSSQIRFNVMIQFCHKTCKPVNCGFGVVSYGRRKREAKPLEVIESSTLGRIIFPDELNIEAKNDDNDGGENFNDEVDVFLTTTTMTSQTENIEGKTLGPIKFPGPVNYEKMKMEQSTGIRIDNFGNPQGVQQYLSDGKISDNEIAESKNDKIVTIPLDITIQIIETDENGNNDRLIIGDSDKVYVAGLG